jgi:hypothetical protein
VSLRRAIACLWTSVLITAVVTILVVIGVFASSDLGGDIFIGLGTIALLGFIAEKLKVGRGWARWVYLVVWVLGSFIGAIAAALTPQVFLSLPLIMKGTFVVQFILQTAALGLLFTSESRQWFRPV